MRRTRLYFALLCMVSIIISSCGQKDISGDKPGPAPVKNVTLNFSTFYEDGVQADTYRDIIKAFEEKHSNIKINLQSGASNYDANIKNALSSGKGPDIIGLQRSRMLEYVKSGDLKDMSSWVEKQDLKNKFYGVNLGYAMFDDKYYGIGDMPYTVEWYYNVDLFKKAGVSEPQNLNELIDVCNKLKKYTQNPIMIGAKDKWVLNTFFGMLTAQTVETDKLSAAYANSDKQMFKDMAGADEALNILNQLIKSGAINKSVADYTYAESMNAFVKGKAAILPMGSFGLDKLEKSKSKDFQYKAFEKPLNLVSTPKSLYSATAIQVITINKKSKYEKEALEFMDFLVSEEAQKIFKEKNGVSGLKSVNKESGNSIKNVLSQHLELTNENSTMYIDNVSGKMMESTGNRLLELINGKIKATEVWQMIVNESHT